MKGIYNRNGPCGIAARGTGRGRGRSALRGEWIRMVRRGDSALICTHIFGLEEFKSAFEMFRQKKENAIKAVLEC